MKVSRPYISATAMVSVFLVYVAVSMLAVPTIDTFDAIDRFFFISIGGILSVKVVFFVYLIKDEAYMSLYASVVHVLQLLAVLGCLYLFFNWRMGTGLFSLAS